MKPPTWHERYVTGVARLDAQHQEIFTLMLALSEATAHGALAADLAPYLVAFRAHVMGHFAEEEAVLQHCAYPEIAHHRAAHHDIAATIADLIQTHNRGEPVMAASVLALGNLLVRHIQTDDLKMATWMREHALA